MAGPARYIKAILGLQISMAAVLFAHDLAKGWPGLSLAPPAPSLTQPAIRTGGRPQSAPATRPMPATGDMAPRLSLTGTDENGTRVLGLRGVVAPGDADRIARELQRTPVARVRLDSPGGSVADALAIGRMLRDAGIAAEVPEDAICLSACPYMLAGGAERHVASTATIGVHQHYFGENTVLPAFMAVANIQRGQADVMAYLYEMGIDLRVMQPALATPPNKIYVIGGAELAELGLITTDPD